MDNAFVAVLAPAKILDVNTGKQICEICELTICGLVIGETLNFSMNFQKKLPDNLNRKTKAYELILSDENLRKLMEIEKLFRLIKSA